nr:zinc finger, CCHC-type [Tanacetum cinerariifolium]
MVAAAMKHMASGFAKLEKIERVDFKRWKKKMHFMLSSMSVVYVLTTPMPDDKGVPQSAQDTDKPKDNNVAGPSVVNMVEHNNSSMYNDHKVKRKHHDTRDNPSKKRKVTCWKCRKPGHLKKDCKAGNVGNKSSISSIKGSEDGSFNPLKGRTLVHGSSCVDLGFSYGKVVAFLNVLHVANIRKNLVSSSVLNNCGYKQMIESKKFVLSKHAFMSTSKLNDLILWHARLGHVYFKRMQDMSKDGLIPVIDMDTAKTRDVISDQHSNCFNVKDDPKTFDEAMKSQEVAFKKEASNDEIDSIMRNYTWVLTDLPPVFNQKLRIDYFDTFVPVARISTIRLLIAMKSIHNLIIHQMDVKTAFLNRDLEEEAPNQWHQKFDEVVLSNGYLLNQADKCMYSKFDASGKGVIICLYVDDMLIFGTNQVQVDLTKNFFSSRFSMKDIGDADVILGIWIKHKSDVSTPLDTCENLMPNRGKLSRYTSNLGTQHWKAIQRVLKYLKKTMDYRLVYSSYPSVLESYTNVSWISNTKDNSSTSGWVFLLGGGVISWASKKQTYITSSTMESEFVALAAAGKEAEWLKNLVFEIPLWVKPMACISICYDSAATLAKAYSQMYNGNSRYLGVRHSMIHELIMNGVVSIEFVKENQEKDKIGSKPDKNGKRGEAKKSLKQFQLKEEEKPKKTKKEWPKTHTLGSLMYAMVCTRLDIPHAAGVVSRRHVVLEGFSDSDYGGFLDSGKSTTGYVFIVGGRGGSGGGGRDDDISIIKYKVGILSLHFTSLPFPSLQFNGKRED